MLCRGNMENNILQEGKIVKNEVYRRRKQKFLELVKKAVKPLNIDDNRSLKR
jgi:hypothetical protein